MDNADQPDTPVSPEQHDAPKRRTVVAQTDMEDRPEQLLRVEGDSPQALVNGVAQAIGMKYVVAASSLHELIMEVAQAAPNGEIAQSIAARLSNVAAVARAAGL